MRLPVGVEASSASNAVDGYGKRHSPPDGFSISQPERTPQRAVSVLFWHLRLPLGSRLQPAPQCRTHPAPEVRTMRKTPPGGTVIAMPLRLIVTRFSPVARLFSWTSVMPFCVPL